MYNSEKEFDAAVRPLWQSILATKPSWYKVDTADIEIKDAWALYKNTRDSLLREQLLGETKMRSDVELMQNFGTASGTKTTAERGTLYNTGNTAIKSSEITAKVSSSSDKEDMLRRGSVLNDGWWWTFKNDAWLVGCAHGLKVMQLSSAGLAQLSDLDELMWDTKAARPRVLGRELIGLNAAGYKRVVHFSYKQVEVNTATDAKGPKKMVKRAFEKEGTIAMLGLTFAPVDRNTAMGLTFKGYYDRIAAFKKLTELRELVSSTSSHGIAYDAYEFPKEATVVTPVQAQQLPGPVLPGSTVQKKTWAQMVVTKT